MKIYVASSWRNGLQEHVVSSLRQAGHDVYDFKNPKPGDSGFHWSEIDQAWRGWNPCQFVSALDHPVAKRGFANDFEAMQQSDACVLVMPCGRSAHLEAGYFVGASKPLHILLTDGAEPELMYKMATRVHLNLANLLFTLAES